MKQVIQTGLVLAALFAGSASAQDWYHDREMRFQGEQWRAHVFEHVRADLDHIGSAVWAAGKERRRLDRTKVELAELQGKLERGGFIDAPELNDVIDSMRKSANDQRLSPRDRDVLGDDLNRLVEFREHRERWKR
jgi:hypothetical protein